MKNTLCNYHCMYKIAAFGAFAIALLASSADAQAYTFCVATATQLQSALTDSSDGGTYANESNLIHVVQGLYKTGSATGNGPFQFHNSATGALNLQGGWDVGCLHRRQKAALTVLDGNNATQVLSLRQASQELDVTAFTIQNGETTLNGGGLAVNFVSGDDARTVINGNIIRDNHTTGYGGGLFAKGGDNSSLSNNLITGNAADNDYGAGSVNWTLGLAYCNTVSRNTAVQVGGTGGLHFKTIGNGYVDNNIFWNNTNYGIYLGSATIRLGYNDYGTQGGFAPFSSDGNLSVTPQFVDATGGDFHLSAGSPLLGVTASPAIGAIDPDGNPYSHLGKGDMGAYNETIFIDGFGGGQARQDAVTYDPHPAVLFGQFGPQRYLKTAVSHAAKATSYISRLAKPEY